MNCLSVLKQLGSEGHLGTAAKAGGPYQLKHAATERARGENKTLARGAKSPCLYQATGWRNADLYKELLLDIEQAFGRNYV